MIGLHQVGNSALTGLRIDSNNRLITSADILRVNWQVRNSPSEFIYWLAGCLCISLKMLKTLLDGVLMATRESGVNQVATIWTALRHWQLITKLDCSLDFIDVAEINHWIDALTKQIQTKCDQIDIAGPFTISKQTTFNAISSSHVAQFRGSNCRASVIVRV